MCYCITSGGLWKALRCKAKLVCCTRPKGCSTTGYCVFTCNSFNKKKKKKLICTDCTGMRGTEGGGDARNEKIDIIVSKCKKDKEKGVAVSYEFSIGCTFLCRRPALLPPSSTSCLCCCPVPIYGSRTQPISSERASHSNREHERWEGWELQTEMSPGTKKCSPPAQTPKPTCRVRSRV